MLLFTTDAYLLRSGASLAHFLSWGIPRGKTRRTWMCFFIISRSCPILDALFMFIVLRQLGDVEEFDPFMIKLEFHHPILRSTCLGLSGDISATS